MHWPPWYDIAGGLTAVSALIVGLTRLLRAVYRVDAALPVLLEIADQFKPNGGSSLHDRLSRIEGRQRKLAKKQAATDRAVRAALIDRGFASPDDAWKYLREEMERDVEEQSAGGAGAGSAGAARLSADAARRADPKAT